MEGLQALRLVNSAFYYLYKQRPFPWTSNPAHPEPKVRGNLDDGFHIAEYSWRFMPNKPRIKGIPGGKLDLLDIYCNRKCKKENSGFLQLATSHSFASVQAVRQNTTLNNKTIGSKTQNINFSHTKETFWEFFSLKLKTDRIYIPNVICSEKFSVTLYETGSILKFNILKLWQCQIWRMQSYYSTLNLNMT